MSFRPTPTRASQPALPQLPENLQYRFVGKHLILYDVRGNLIVDYMLNAIP